MILDRNQFREPVRALLNRYDAPLGLTAQPAADPPDVDRVLQTPAKTLFPEARHPEASVSGLLLIIGAWPASHGLSQGLSTSEGSYWHAIAHRMEPDAFNAGYWFRRVGNHAIYPALHREARMVLQNIAPSNWVLAAAWDPFQFIDWCEEARQEGDPKRTEAAVAIHNVECQLLFQWCSQSSQDARSTAARP